MFTIVHSFFALAQGGEQEILRSGKLLFQVNCSRCHGMLGHGGTGPSLVRANLPRASTDEQLARVISNGIPGTGMPAAWVLTEAEVEKVLKYVRFISQGKEEVIKGNIENGKRLFENSECSSCHIISGIGGSLGPDLTSVGLKRGQQYLVTSISHPGKSKPVSADGYYEFLLMSIFLKNGEIIDGIRINEDTFSVQIKDASNRLHSFKKEDILSIERSPDRSLMPSFKDKFSTDELNDIAAYLTSLK